MKKLVYIGILCSSFPTSTLFAQCGPANNIIQNTSTIYNIGLNNSTDQVGQSFTATCSGNIEAITVKNSANVTAGDIMLTLYDGVNPNNPLDSVIVAISLQNASNDLLITLPTPVFLTNGNAYTFMLRNMTGSSSYRINETDPYASGGFQFHLFGSSIFDNAYDSVDLYFEIHYQDNIPPVGVCQDVTVELDQTGNVVFTPSLIGSLSSDDSGIFTLSMDTTYNCNDIGANTVVLSVIDPAGNSATCNAVITVVDLLAPEITCPGNQDTTLAAGDTYFLPDYISTGIVSIIDNCLATLPNTTQTPIAGTQLAPGINLVSITAEDEYGNIGTCNFEINVGYLSLVEMDLSGIEIYPNPVSNWVNIKNHKGLNLEQAIIYDLMGNLILTTQLNESISEQQLDLSHLNRGIYFVVIKTIEGHFIQQLIKNE
jgi:hypothetical protein